eukprot:748643-Heterocapsa_arctica.AAC.1
MGFEGQAPRGGSKRAPRSASPRRELRPRLAKRGPGAWTAHRPEHTSELRRAGTSRLLIHAVSDNTHKSYSPMVRAFLYDARLRGAALNTAAQIDLELVSYMDDLCYVQHAGVQAATKTFAGLMHLAPELKTRLPLSARALTSWQRLNNAAEGGPVPEEGIALIMQEMLRVGRFASAVICLA